MQKQWTNKNLGVNYFYIPQSHNILTSDGVLLDSDEIYSISTDDYAKLKETASQYDYKRSRTEARLVEKSEIEESKPLTKEEIDEMRKMFEASSNNITVEKPLIKETKVKTEKVAQVKSKKKINIADVVQRYIMLIISIIASVVSIYYTSTYLHSLGNPYVFSIILSSGMLLYALISFQYVMSFWRNKKFIISFVLLITFLLSTLYSIYSSFSVNMSKYQWKLDSSKVYEQNLNNSEDYVNQLYAEREELTEKKSLYMSYVEKEYSNITRTTAEKIVGELDTPDLQYQYSNRYKTNMAVIKESDEKIEGYLLKIEEINETLKDVNNQIKKENESTMKLVEEHSVMQNRELSDILGEKFGFDGNILQLIITSFASVFVDVIAPFALMLYNFGTMDEKKKTKKGK